MGQIGATAQSAEDDVRRAAERVSLACRALSTAASDLRVAKKRSGAMAVEDAADQLSAETERICELADELAKLGRELTNRPLAGAARER
jgi:hypothetical protein